MEARGYTFAAAGTIITVRIGSFAWLEADVARLTDRVDGVERDVALVRGPLSLALPARAGHSGSSPHP